MNNTYDLKSILTAIEELNVKKKKTTSLAPSNINKIKENTSLALSNINKIKKKTSINDGILPITEKLILEAEKYSQNIKKDFLVLKVSNEDVLILDKEYNG